MSNAQFKSQYDGNNAQFIAHYQEPATPIVINCAPALITVTGQLAQVVLTSGSTDIIINATPAQINVTGVTATVVSGGTIPPPPPLNTNYASWLVDQSAIRCILIEVQAKSGGSETNRFLSSRPFKSANTDTPADTVYNPIIVGSSVRTVERMSVTDESASVSFGDIELVNVDGSIDTWLSDIWSNRAINVLHGDVRWNRSDFQVIFSGVVEDIGSRSRNTLNLKLRDKLQRLNTPVTEAVLGGSTNNKNQLIPLTFGECHNISPLLTNPATLEYQVHNGQIERIIEVRDNGVPVSATPTLATGKFTLVAQPFGKVTASVQGRISQFANLLTYSEQFNNAIWTENAIVTANATVAPDGTMTADLLTDNSNTISMLSRQIVSVPNDSSTYAFSVYVKANTTRFVALWLSFQGSVTRERIWTFDLLNAESAPDGLNRAISGTITDVGDGWNRISVVAANTGEGNTSLHCLIYPASSTTKLGHVNPAATGSAYFWGAQLEVGEIASTYTKTEAAQLNIFPRTSAGIIRQIVLNYGSADTRFFQSDLDVENFQESENKSSQPIGLYLAQRENLLSLCNRIAATVGSRLVMSRTGQLRLIKVELPAPGTPFAITKDDVLVGSMRITEKLAVQPGVKLGYCKNWTVQEPLDTRIPNAHKDLYAREWLTTYAKDEAVKTDYKLDGEPDQQDTYLLTEADASAEATRILNMFKTPRFIVEFDATARALQLELGQAVTITYPRFGMDAGKSGMVVGLSPDWDKSQVTVEVLV